MNVLHARVALRERPLLDVVDLTVRFCVRHARAYAKVSALVLGPVFLGTWAAATRVGWGWGWTVTFAASSLVEAPFTVLASRLVFEREVRTRDVLLLALRATPRLLGMRLLELALLVVGTLFFLLPGVWLSVLFLFVTEVVVLERASAGVALSRMHRLAGSSFGDALMAFLFLLSLHIVFVFVGDVTGRAVLEELLEISAPPSMLEAKGSALGLAAFWLFLPFGATCRFLLYLNVRTRIEGWDIQTRFAAIAAREGARDLEGGKGLAS